MFFNSSGAVIYTCALDVATCDMSPINDSVKKQGFKHVKVFEPALLQ